MFKRFKLHVLQTLAAYRGRLVSVVAGIIMGIITSVFTRFGLNIDDYWSATISGAVSLGTGWALDVMLLTVNATSMGTIQRNLQEVDPEVEVDKVAMKNGQTIQSVEKLVQEVKDSRHSGTSEEQIRMFLETSPEHLAKVEAMVRDMRDRS
jgi:hypothetical protein